jgi:hypothetical protein
MHRRLAEDPCPVFPPLPLRIVIARRARIGFVTTRPYPRQACYGLKQKPTDEVCVMNEPVVDQAEAEILPDEVSDDALEAAAGNGEMPGRTFYGCLPPVPLTMSYGCPAIEWKRA